MTAEFTLYDFLSLPAAALPVVVAFWRHHQHRWAITVLTAICHLVPWLILGVLYLNHAPRDAYLGLNYLTLPAALGWFAAIVWSFTAVKQERES